MNRLKIVLLGLLLISCGKSVEDKKGKEENSTKKYTKFNGSYAKTFNDLPDLHIEAAIQNGVGPIESRTDTTKYMDDLVKISNKSKVYTIDKLKHSVPFLVPKAEELLEDIASNFKDSLLSKKKPLYKLIVTSVTRTDDDVKDLSRRNRNASENSAHRYGTTFDIAWTRFEKVDEKDGRDMDDGKLKAILGQVLHDLKERDRCYIKHERKQACFHITVR